MKHIHSNHIREDDLDDYRQTNMSQMNKITVSDDTSILTCYDQFRSSHGFVNGDDFRSSQRKRFDEHVVAKFEPNKPLDTSQNSDILPTRDTGLPYNVHQQTHQEGSESKVPSGAVDLRDKYKEQILKKLDSKAMA